ncbi:MAG: Ig-like domain-containing protein, partial [Phycisphaerae bacterium]
CTYNPNANFNGADSFTFKANDGTVDSNTATVSITVSPVNDPPVEHIPPEHGQGDVACLGSGSVRGTGNADEIFGGNLELPGCLAAHAKTPT